MLSAVITSGRSKPAVPLAGQLTHQRFVRPGPLVLGTALLKAPARMEDRDRHDCYRPPAPSPAGGQIISAWLCMSPCRSDHIFTTLSGGVRHMVSEDSGPFSPAFPADFPHRSDCHWSLGPVPAD